MAVLLVVVWGKHIVKAICRLFYWVFGGLPYVGKVWIVIAFNQAYFNPF